MRRWYFAYHDVNGVIFPFSWAEDDGLCVGGRPNEIQDSKVEISEELFNGELKILERIYPIKLPKMDFPSTD